MRNKLFLEVKKNWQIIGQYKKLDKNWLELELYKKLLDVFQVGDFYYLVFVPSLVAIEHTSNSVAKVLGYPSNEISLHLILENIHPDDLPTFTSFEEEVVRFKTNLPANKLMKYKSRYTFRLKRKDGKYIQVMQQSITIQCDEDGAVLRNLVVHTDVSDLKKDNQMSLSFIGLEGEPSFYNVLTNKNLLNTNSSLTKREKEILQLLAQNKSTEDIANQLFISKDTVSTHRKNMHAKTGAKTVLELVMKAMEKGWL